MRGKHYKPQKLSSKQVSKPCKLPRLSFKPHKLNWLSTKTLFQLRQCASSQAW